MSFDVAFARTVIGHEGGYSNNPADLGGETFCGISRRHHPSWAGWPVLDSYDIDARKTMRLEQDLELSELVSDFYYENFWLMLRLDKITNAQLACEIFESGVNVGPARVIRWLQRSVNALGSDNLIVDGGIGPKTISAVNGLLKKKLEQELLKTLNGLQLCHYLELVERNASQKIFYRGWLKRVN